MTKDEKLSISSEISYYTQELSKWTARSESTTASLNYSARQLAYDQIDEIQDKLRELYSKLFDINQQEKSDLIAKITRNVNDMIRYQIKIHVDKEAPEPYDSLLGAQTRFEDNLRQLLEDK